MHSVRKTSITSEQISLGDNSLKLSLAALVVGGAGILIALIGFYLRGDYQVSDEISYGWFKRFLFSYHTSFCFCLSISVGALFVVLILNLTRAGWGVVIRRLAEVLASVILPMFILFAPVLLVTFQGRGETNGWGSTIYIWNNETFLNANSETMFEMKQSYLNCGWFGLRMLIYFLALGGIALYFFLKSTKQDDSGDKKISLSMQKASAPFTILFAFVLVFASFDLEMSLAPRWFSTMFPVYFFAGSVMAIFATLIICSQLLQKNGILTDEITDDHYHDLTKLMFAFVFFWGYIAFSQFMLIWYANIPEETFWFRYRVSWEAGRPWAIISLLLLFGHLLLPFVCLLARNLRRNRKYIFRWAIVLLFFHWLDHYWIVMPQFGADPSGAITANSNMLPASPAEILCDASMAIGMLGLFMAMVFRMAGSRSLIPKKDPRLVESLNFQNI